MIKVVKKNAPGGKSTKSKSNAPGGIGTKNKRVQRRALAIANINRGKIGEREKLMLERRKKLKDEGYYTVTDKDGNRRVKKMTKIQMADAPRPRLGSKIQMADAPRPRLGLRKKK
tara:strand:- start:170 stop:514 length:345 start_codon:yes stop_codon:yes gene_type:complete